MKYRVNKEKCSGCATCTVACPEGIQIGEDGKAEVIDQEQLKKCGGVSVCPFGAIEEVEESEDEEENKEEVDENKENSQN